LIKDCINFTSEKLSYTSEQIEMQLVGHKYILMHIYGKEHV